MPTDKPSAEQLLQACRAAMVESMRYYGSACTNWGNMIAAIDALAAAHPEPTEETWCTATGKAPR